MVDTIDNSIPMKGALATQKKDEPVVTYEQRAQEAARNNPQLVEKIPKDFDWNLDINISDEKIIKKRKPQKVEYKQEPYDFRNR